MSEAKKHTSVCPKCGSTKSTFEGPLEFECGTYQSIVGGSHIHHPVFKLMESSHCKDRQSLAKATKRVAALEEGINRVLPDLNCRMFEKYHEALKAVLET